MRKLLQIVLMLLSKKALRKHQIELIVVTGWIGLDLVKDGIYQILSEKYIVRRNVNPVWWDLSIPLNILGYEDNQRGFLGWLNIILRSIFLIHFGPSNKHILILTAESGREDTAKYWKGFLMPSLLVVVNNKKESEVTNILVKNTAQKGVVIYDKDDLGNTKIKNGFDYGINTDATVMFKENKEKITVKYKKYSVSIPKYFAPAFTKGIIAPVIACAISKGMSMDEIANGFIKFDMRNTILKKLSNTIATEK
jgi:UDP-N-acetylmuramyl pentapeptide synthase